MKENEIQNELASIRGMMERSSKFISLSGLSGVLAGIYALIGARVADELLYSGERRDTYNPKYYSFQYFMGSNIGQLTIVAFVVVIASIVTAIILSLRKAKRTGQNIWGIASQRVLFYGGMPLLAGGFLILILLYKNIELIDYIFSLTLIFYGLALVSASNFTYSDVRYLGLLEIILGLIAACLPGYGLVFWAIGFGVLHIVYGSMMHFKYDR